MAVAAEAAEQAVASSGDIGQAIERLSTAVNDARMLIAILMREAQNMAQA